MNIKVRGRPGSRAGALRKTSLVALPKKNYINLLQILFTIKKNLTNIIQRH